MLHKVARLLLGRRNKQAPPVRPQLNGTWTDQHARLLRSHRRLQAVLANRSEPADVDYDALDALYHFCDDALNLRDWVKADLPRRHGRSAEKLIKHSKPLAACADIANGSKHLTLTQWHTPQGPAQVSARHVDDLPSNGEGLCGRPGARRTRGNGTRLSANRLRDRRRCEWEVRRVRPCRAGGQRLEYLAERPPITVNWWATLGVNRMTVRRWLGKR